MTHLHHVTLTTHDSRRSPRAAVAEAPLVVVAAWVQEMLLREEPLPVPALAPYRGEALISPGGLVVTISGPGGPLVTMGVSRRSRGAPALWGHLAALAERLGQGPPTARPESPWLGVVLLPPLMAEPAAAEWLGDLERCIAWAWIERLAR